MNPRRFLPIILLANLASLPVSGTEPRRLAVLQDEVEELPPDNTAFFSAARRISIRLDVLAATQLNLDETRFTVIRPNGEKSEFKPDQNGTVTIDQVEDGPHALVASNRRAHGTKLMYFVAEDERAAEQRAADPLPVSRMTMLESRGRTLRPFVEQIREYGQAGPYGELPAQVTSTAPFDYKIRLASDGTLKGRVLSVLKTDGDISIEGTRVVAFRAGQPIGESFCDGSGYFELAGVGPGVNGLIASGPAGYAAFAFESVEAEGVVMMNSHNQRFTTAQTNDVVPVVLVPPQFLPDVVEVMTEYYPSLQDDAPEAPLFRGEALALPVGGSMIPAAPASAATATSGAGGGGAAAGGGLGGLGAVAAIGAAAAASGSDRRAIGAPGPASPAIP